MPDRNSQTEQWQPVINYVIHYNSNTHTGAIFTTDLAIKLKMGSKNTLKPNNQLSTGTHCTWTSWMFSSY